MNTTILQVPIEKSFRNDVSKVVEEMGFSSLQDYIRLFLKKTLKGEVGVSIERFPAVKLSAKNAKRYDKMVDDYYAGKLKTKSFDNVDKMMDYLNSDNPI